MPVGSMSVVLVGAADGSEVAEAVASRAEEECEAGSAAPLPSLVAGPTVPALVSSRWRLRGGIAVRAEAAEACGVGAPFPFPFVELLFGTVVSLASA